jgi:uncharacterized membrane protein YqjE
MATTADPQPPPSEGLEGSLRRFAYSIAQVLQTRLEILSTEIAEERVNLTRLALGALLVLFCLQAGLLLGVLFIVLAVGGEQRLVAIGIAALGLLVTAVVLALVLRGWLKRRPPMFGATMTELRKDRERLRGSS